MALTFTTNPRKFICPNRLWIPGNFPVWYVVVWYPHYWSWNFPRIILQCSPVNNLYFFSFREVWPTEVYPIEVSYRSVSHRYMYHRLRCCGCIRLLLSEMTAWAWSKWSTVSAIKKHAFLKFWDGTLPIFRWRLEIIIAVQQHSQPLYIVRKREGGLILSKKKIPS